MENLSINLKLEKTLLQLKEINETFKTETDRICLKSGVKYIDEPDRFSDRISDCTEMVLKLISDDIMEQLYS